MKTLKNKIILGAVALTSLSIATTSCSDDFLKEDSGHMPLDGLLETADGAKAMAAGLYGNIRWHFGYEWAYGITLYGTDEFTNGADLTSEPWNTYDSRLNPLDCTPANGAANKNCPGVSALWDQMYYGISTSNLILSKANKIQEEDERNKAMGEAYFLRGYNYFRLFSQYGGVVIRTEPSADIVQYFERATEEATLNQVIADLQSAYELLPTSKWRGNGTWTKYTAAHFLAKALLYRQSERCEAWNSAYPADVDLKKVVDLADEIIAACPLAPDYNDLYANWTGVDCANEGLSEILMTAEHNGDNNTTGRFGNRTYNYYNPQFSNFSAGYVQRGQYIGGMDFQRCRPTEYTYSIFDNVNDARMWKTFKTTYGMNNYVAPEKMLKGSVPDEKAPVLGDVGILFILNKKDDVRFQDTLTYGSFGRGAVEHTFVDPTTNKWVPNVFPVYLGGKYVLNTFGVSGNPATSNVFCGINKTDDGSRTGEKNDAHRDVIMARTGETYLVKAEAQVRMGKYAEAITTVNELRARAQWKQGEDREAYVDGSIAFEKNSTSSASLGKCKNEKGEKITNGEAYKYSFVRKSSYYISTGIDTTTEASNLQIESYTKLPAEDEAVLAAVGASGDKERMIHFILNERTRELLGEWNRWEELSRTKTLVTRAKLYNPEAAQNVSEKHILRPIPQKFIDTLQDKNGNNLPDSEKEKWQNPGY